MSDKRVAVWKSTNYQSCQETSTDLQTFAKVEN